MIANELALSVMIAVAMMSIQLVVRHTRAEEESGAAELVRAGVVGRRARADRGAGHRRALADAAVGVVVAAGLAGSGLAAVDSFALAVGIGLAGLVFGGGRRRHRAAGRAAPAAATGAALAVLACAGRWCAGSATCCEPDGSPLSWLSPLGLGAADPRVRRPARGGRCCCRSCSPRVLVAAAYRAGRPARRGRRAAAAPAGARPGASALLAGPVGLPARLQRGRGARLDGRAAAARRRVRLAADAVTDMVAGNPRLADALARRERREPHRLLLRRRGACTPALGAAGVRGRLGAARCTARRRRPAGGAAGHRAGPAPLPRPARSAVDRGRRRSCCCSPGPRHRADRRRRRRRPGRWARSWAPARAPARRAGGRRRRRRAGRPAPRGWPRWPGPRRLVAARGLFGALLALPEWAPELSPFGWVPQCPGRAVRRRPARRAQSSPPRCSRSR